MNEDWLLLISPHNYNNAGKNVSKSTLGKIVCEAGLYDRIANKKPLLMKQNNVKRL